jgi:hypothetical protein
MVRIIRNTQIRTRDKIQIIVVNPGCIVVTKPYRINGAPPGSTSKNLKFSPGAILHYS